MTEFLEPYPNEVSVKLSNDFSKFVTRVLCNPTEQRRAYSTKVGNRLSEKKGENEHLLETAIVSLLGI